MPFPNYHSARIEDPKNFTKFSYKKNEFGGVDVVYGISDGKTKVQAIRFDKKEFSPSEAKRWLKERDYTPISFTPASENEAETFSISTADAGPYYFGLMNHGDPTVPGKNKKMLKKALSDYGSKNTISEKITTLLRRK